MPTVVRLSVTPIKGLGLQHPDEILLERTGVAENRRFFLLDRSGRRVSGLKHGPLVRIAADYDCSREHLTLRFPDGRVVDGEISLGRETSTDFWGREVKGNVVDGPWGEALSEYVGKPLRLVRTQEPAAGYDIHPATILSEASVQKLGEESGTPEGADAKRFRMLIGIDGCGPHEEDTWEGRHVRIGEALVQVLGPVPRCATTEQNTTSGRRDFPTLKAIKAYRGVRDGKAIDFGVYADVLEPGRIRVGDPVEPQPL